MRTLEKSELNQVSGAGLLGLSLNLLNLVGVKARVDLGGNHRSGRGGRGYDRCERSNRGHRRDCY
ncbi:hypothetical protein DFR49_4159 [Hephaestia caeni]|uniref:Uncharacterized protein n=1 Tax=Hephaestia caeni TaxID=645617 RepID=A0A397NNL8_9SPHN|nr:hypothetical protein [Hephaestia caeni]RIA36867.1 hypothetical protein DFR49_4159 [Hephaestia caeni]